MDKTLVREKGPAANLQAAVPEKEQTLAAVEDHHCHSKDTHHESNAHQTRNHTTGILYIILNNILYISSRLKYRF